MDFRDDEKRVKSIQCNNDYIFPRFDKEELKWTSKSRNELYLRFLAQAYGESQFEYRERLKWEFSENNNIKKILNGRIHSLSTKKPAIKPQLTKNSKEEPVEWEWNMECMTQDMWERRMWEEMDRRNDEYVDRMKEFWEN